MLLDTIRNISRTGKKKAAKIKGSENFKKHKTREIFANKRLTGRTKSGKIKHEKSSGKKAAANKKITTAATVV